jgi:hypothetical protein
MESFVSAHPLCLEIFDTAVLQHENRRGTDLIRHTSWTVSREFASVAHGCREPFSGELRSPQAE